MVAQFGVISFSCVGIVRDKAIGQKLTRVLGRKNSDYYKDKNVILASAGPSLETQLDDIATY